jgi:hypothetical protein
MMTRYKNKLVYNSETGEIRDDRRFMTMLEDFWLPRREGTKGTEIDTLPGGSNLGEMDDVEYFKKQLYKSLNIPVSRMESDGAFNLGRPSEITRDELHFNKFITRLRNKFSGIFDRMLETQLVLKGVINKKQWKQIREEIRYEFTSDNLFTEQKEAEILRDRIALANEADPFVGRYISTEYVWKKIFRMTEEEIDKMKKQMKADEKDEQAPESLTLQGMEMDQETQQAQVAGMETDKLKEKEADQPGVAKTPADRQAAAADKKKVADKNPTPNPNQKNEETETDLQILESINKLLNEINE